MKSKKPKNETTLTRKEWNGVWSKVRSELGIVDWPGQWVMDKCEKWVEAILKEKSRKRRGE